MTTRLSSEELLAAAIYEIRLLLGSYLGSECSADESVRVAAHLAYALHNHALAVLEGGPSDVGATMGKIGAVDHMLGSELLQRLPIHAGKADV
jgi:hypothetical protein